MLVERVACIWASGVRRRRKHIVEFDDADDVGGVAAARAFGVVRVDGSPFDGRDGGLDEAGFVERVCVDERLDVVFVADCQAGVDGGGGAAPVFVELEAADARFGLLLEGAEFGIVAFSCYAVVHRECVDGLEHLSDVCLAWSAGCCVCTCAGSCAASEHSRDA